MFQRKAWATFLDIARGWSNRKGKYTHQPGLLVAQWLRHWHTGQELPWGSPWVVQRCENAAYSPWWQTLMMPLSYFAADSSFGFRTKLCVITSAMRRPSLSFPPVSGEVLVPVSKVNFSTVARTQLCLPLNPVTTRHCLFQSGHQFWKLRFHLFDSYNKN